MARPVIAAAILAVALAACQGSEGTPEPVAQEPQCWGDYEAGGSRMGPYPCAGDGVTPIIR